MVFAKPYGSPPVHSVPSQKSALAVNRTAAATAAAKELESAWFLEPSRPVSEFCRTEPASLRMEDNGDMGTYHMYQTICQDSKHARWD